MGVEVAETGDEVEVAGHDSGPGVPPEEQALRVEKFSQTSWGESVRGGSGLSLVICRHLVEAHGGPDLGRERARPWDALRVSAAAEWTGGGAPAVGGQASRGRRERPPSLKPHTEGPRPARPTARANQTLLSSRTTRGGPPALSTFLRGL